MRPALRYASTRRWTAPRWATLERQLLADNVPACREFFDKYFDDARLPAVLRALGRQRRTGRRVRELQPLAGAARAGRERRDPPDVPQGPRRADRAVHRGEDDRRADRAARACTTRSSSSSPTGCTTAKGCSSSTAWALSVPDATRTTRSARGGSPAFYMGEDPEAPNYDPAHKIIRSMITAAAGRCCGRRRRSTGSAIRSTSRDSTRCTASRRSSSSSRTTRNTATSSAITSSIWSPRRCRPTPTSWPASPSTRRGSSSTWTRGWTRMKQNGGIIPSFVDLDGTIGGPDGQVVEATPTAGASARSIRSPAAARIATAFRGRWSDSATRCSSPAIRSTSTRGAR